MVYMFHSTFIYLYTSPQELDSKFSLLKNIFQK